MATQPLKEALRDREKDIERLRKVSPPERRRLGPTQINGTKTHESHPALDDHHQSSEDTYRPVKDSQAASGSDGEGEGGPVQPLQTSSRRGIWEWAKAGTGRLGMIGSIPETQEDGFDISAAITSEKSDVQPDEQTPPSKVTVFGLSHSNIAPSPSFSQTKRSSDELVAASSTTTTPATLNRPTQSWTSGKQITPMPITEHSPPLTPETPTPPQRRRDTPVDTNGTTTPPPKNTPAVENASAAKSQSNGASPTTASPATQTASGSKTPPVRKYKIVLNPNMISPGRSSPSMAK